MRRADKQNLPRHHTIAGSCALALLVVGCGQPTTEATLGQDKGAATTQSEQADTGGQLAIENADATRLAEQTQTKVSSVTKVVTITENNDPNNLIGRPNGYVSAAVLYDKSVSCTQVGTDCGAMIEVWPDEAAAQARSKYIQESIKSMPMLGQEYHSIKGSALLRVDGNVKPSIASTYSGTF